MQLKYEAFVEREFGAIKLHDAVIFKAEFHLLFI
jgi:hypothetical protein